MPAARKPDTRLEGSVRVHAGVTRPVYTRLTKDDYKLLERVAREKGTTPSTYMRSVIERALNNERKRRNT